MGAQVFTWNPLAKAAEGYERMLSGNGRFRVVLTMEA